MQLSVLGENLLKDSRPPRCRPPDDCRVAANRPRRQLLTERTAPGAWPAARATRISADAPKPGDQSFGCQLRISR